MTSKSIVILIFCFVTNSILSQSDIKVSSFFLSPLTYNPAYAGSYEYITISSFYSSQWVGFDGAPKTININAHGTFLGPNTGLGIEFINDEIGVTSTTKVLMNYAYHLRLNKNWNLSMCIKAGTSYNSVNYGLLNIENPINYPRSNTLVNNLNPNIGTGLFLHNDKFFFGLGIPNLLKNKFADNFKTTLANSTPNYYVSTGYSFDLNNNIQLQPSLLTRIVKGSPVNTLLATTLNWKEKFYSSINLDFNASVGAFVGFRFLDIYMIGYSYDTSINNFSNSNNGIHSFFLNIRFNDYWGRKRCSCYSF